MIAPNPLARPATIAQIKSACLGCSADFIVTQTERGATLADAKEAHIRETNIKIRSMDSKIATLERDLSSMKGGALEALATQHAQEIEAIKAEHAQAMELLQIKYENIRMGLAGYQ